MILQVPLESETHRDPKQQLFCIRWDLRLEKKQRNVTQNADWMVIYHARKPTWCSILTICPGEWWWYVPHKVPETSLKIEHESESNLSQLKHPPAVLTCLKSLWKVLTTWFYMCFHTKHRPSFFANHLVGESPKLMQRPQTFLLKPGVFRYHGSSPKDSLCPVPKNGPFPVWNAPIKLNNFDNRDSSMLFQDICSIIQPLKWRSSESNSTHSGIWNPEAATNELEYCTGNKSSMHKFHARVILQFVKWIVR